jgi:hypothetical protein
MMDATPGVLAAAFATLLGRRIGKLRKASCSHQRQHGHAAQSGKVHFDLPRGTGLRIARTLLIDGAQFYNRLI